MAIIKYLENNNEDRTYELNDKKLFCLFTGDNVNYKLKTDGLVEVSDVWIDKWPYYRDSDLTGFGTLKRHEVVITDPSFVLIEKNINGKKIKNFYLNSLYIEALAKNKYLSYTQIEFNERTKMIVKSLNESVWMLKK